MTKLSITSFETEEHILLAGTTDAGALLDVDQCQRLFTLPAEAAPLPDDVTISSGVQARSAAMRQEILDDLGKKNTVCFAAEMDKLDRWGDDQRNALKAALKELEDQIRETKRSARLAPNLPEKLSLERAVRNLESRRDEAWRQYDGAAKEIEKKKDALIDEVQQRMEQRVNETPIFAIRWRVR